MFSKNFFPTPDRLNKKLFENIDLSKVVNFLEPSAGKGDILKYFEKIKEKNYNYKYSKISIDCIEIEEDLRAILKSKNYRVIYDDFLTFNTFKTYNLVIMNPPFSEGDKHLLKAIELCKYGGKIRCILNAETIENIYTNTRKDLNIKLKELNAKIEFIENAFSNAERKTGVRIAIVKIDIEKQNEFKSDIFEKLQKKEYYKFEEKIKDSTDMMYSDFIKSIISQYNFEIKLGIKLIKEYLATSNKLSRYIKKNESKYDYFIFTLKIGDKNIENINIGINLLIKEIRMKYWRTLFDSKKFGEKMTSKMRGDFFSKIETLSEYDFNEFNIGQIQNELQQKYLKSIEDTIINLFDDFSRKYNWYDETSKNIHYYNGWKINKSWKINKKVIIPMYGVFDNWDKKFNPTCYSVVDKLEDIEKTFNYLSGIKNNHGKMLSNLEIAKQIGQTKKIGCEYFMLTFYKKGTCHIEFTDLKLLDKFNIFGSQRKNWLPPNFGKKSYGKMNKEEQDIINEFCDEEKYNEFYLQKDYYLTNRAELLE